MFAAKNLVVFSTFHIKVQLFSFLLKTGKKKVYGRGPFLEREGRETVNTTFYRGTKIATLIL